MLGSRRGEVEDGGLEDGKRMERGWSNCQQYFSICMNREEIGEAIRNSLVNEREENTKMVPISI